MFNKQYGNMLDGINPEDIAHCGQGLQHGGPVEFNGLTETFLTGTPLLDDVGSLVQIENVDWRWLIDGVVQPAAAWKPADRRHVIEGGCGFRIKGPLVVEGPIFAYKVASGGTPLFFALTDGTITARATTTPGTGTVDLLDSSLTATGESVTVGNPYGASIADSTYVTVGILDDGTYGITGSDCP